MAVFFFNVCKFNDCGLTFKNLGRLIQHIEENHIDYDPQVVEQKERQQPSCVPLSYVLRFFTDAARREVMKPLQAQANNCHTSSVRMKNDSSTGIEREEDFTSELDDSNDSWATTEEFSTDFILRYGSRGGNRSVTNVTNENNTDKPFACPVPGCKKRYKNVNGIKYHSKNGHKNDGKVRKAFKCSCGKNYKTLYGLKNHTSVRHGDSMPAFKVLRSEMEIDQEERVPQETTLTEEIKVPAMEDHVYVKQNRPNERDCETLGIITPASTPPLATQSSTKIESNLYDRQVRSLHNYFAVANSDHAYNN